MNGLADYLEMNVDKQRDEVDYDVSEIQLLILLLLRSTE